MGFGCTCPIPPPEQVLDCSRVEKHSLRCGKKLELVLELWTFDEDRVIGLLDIQEPLGVEEEPRTEWRGLKTGDSV